MQMCLPTANYMRNKTNLEGKRILINNQKVWVFQITDTLNEIDFSSQLS